MGVDRKMDEKTGTLRKQRGRASVVFENPPLIMAAASTVGKKEGDGPLGVQRPVSLSRMRKPSNIWNLTEESRRHSLRAIQMLYTRENIPLTSPRSVR